HVGPLLLVRHYVDRLGLVGLVDEAVPMRGRAMLTHGEGIAALGANRLCGPAPLYDVTGWASSAAMAELFGVPAGLLNDDRLGRALEALGPGARGGGGEMALGAAGRGGARAAGAGPRDPPRGRPVPGAPGHGPGSVHRRL